MHSDDAGTVQSKTVRAHASMSAGTTSDPGSVATPAHESMKAFESNAVTKGGPQETARASSASKRCVHAAGTSTGAVLESIAMSGGPGGLARSDAGAASSQAATTNVATAASACSARAAMRRGF